MGRRTRRETETETGARGKAPPALGSAAQRRKVRATGLDELKGAYYMTTSAEPRIVSHFSCGAASAIATKLVLASIRLTAS